MISGLNHVTFSVRDLGHSVVFYRDVLGFRLGAIGPRLAYFDLDGLWIALNEEPDIDRSTANPGYTHIAFTVQDESFDEALSRLSSLGVNILEGRTRDPAEGRSVYFTDPDGHRLELHTGSLESRLEYYKRGRPEVRIL